MSNYTRKFFGAILDYMAIVISMWGLFIFALLTTFIIFYFFDVIINPWFPIGFVLIYGIFKKDGLIDTLINGEDE